MLLQERSRKSRIRSKESPQECVGRSMMRKHADKSVTVPAFGAGQLPRVGDVTAASESDTPLIAARCSAWNIAHVLGKLLPCRNT